MQVLTYNVAVILEKSLEHKLILLSKELAKEGKTIFALAEGKLLPHLTIYYASYPKNNLPRIVQTMGTLKDSISAFELVFDKVSAGEGYLMAEYCNTPQLDSLQKTIVTALNPLREGSLRDKYGDEEYLNNLSTAKRLNIKNYGQPNLFKEFTPHLTLLRYANNELAEQVASKLPWNELKLRVEKLGLFETGNNGSAFKLLYSLELN